MSILVVIRRNVMMVIIHGIVRDVMIRHGGHGVTIMVVVGGCGVVFAAGVVVMVVVDHVGW